MAGGARKYRHLSRNSAHRQALLRNLVTSLFEQESISTTWAKAKEAQRLAEKLVTLGKRNTEASRRKAHSIFFRPLEMVPKLFSTIRERYADRPGGYTRVLRIEPLKEDQAPSAILELVDGPKDIRFNLTAQTIARDQELGRRPTDLTRSNIAKVTKFRGATDPSSSLNMRVDEGGDMVPMTAEEAVKARTERAKKELNQMVQKFRTMEATGEMGRRLPKKEKVYPERSESYYSRAAKVTGDTGAGGSAGMSVGRI
ncbi:hypothetical protein FH972_026280 [Carpinus fangiana]|uniref:Ribosomal protein L17 n=1 Tax=Carpinus fangiana TaxID=176857 RepID=A0A5N6L3P1_9ROSI|nr:hypothetical protein FH972_026280 [Carpinus fangiana]